MVPEQLEIISINQTERRNKAGWGEEGKKERKGGQWDALDADCKSSEQNV